MSWQGNAAKRANAEPYLIFLPFTKKKLNLPDSLGVYVNELMKSEKWIIQTKILFLQQNICLEKELFFCLPSFFWTISYLPLHVINCPWLCIISKLVFSTRCNFPTLLIGQQPVWRKCTLLLLKNECGLASRPQGGFKYFWWVLKTYKYKHSSLPVWPLTPRLTVNPVSLCVTANTSIFSFLSA